MPRYLAIYEGSHKKLKKTMFLKYCIHTFLFLTKISVLLGAVSSENVFWISSAIPKIPWSKKCIFLLKSCDISVCKHMWYEKLYILFDYKVVKFNFWTPCKCIFCSHRAKTKVWYIENIVLSIKQKIYVVLNRKRCTYKDKKLQAGGRFLRNFPKLFGK